MKHLKRKTLRKKDSSQSNADLSESKVKSTRLEKDIEKEILTWLNLQQKCKAWKNKSTGTYDPIRRCFRKNNGPFTEKGTSDIIGIYHGRMLCIEVKSAKGRLRPEQKDFLQAMANLGAICILARDLRDVVVSLDSLLRNPRNDPKSLC